MGQPKPNLKGQINIVRLRSGKNLEPSNKNGDEGMAEESDPIPLVKEVYVEDEK